MTVFRITGKDGEVTVSYTKNEPNYPYKDILNIDPTFVPGGLPHDGVRIDHLALQQWKDDPEWFILKSTPGHGSGGIVLSRDEARHLAFAILGELGQDDLDDVLHTTEHLRELDALDATYLEN